VLPAIVVFVVVTGLCLGLYAAAMRLPALLEQRRLERRLRELSMREESQDVTLLAQQTAGPLPLVDRFIGGMGAGPSLARLIEQSGVRTTAGAVVLMSVASGLATGMVTLWVLRQPVAAFAAGCVGSLIPFAWLRYKRAARFKQFEEQFPEALDLLSRALRSGHAFQSAMGMVAEELPAPVGTEFRKSFDQQNFGLPLRDALNQLADRVPLVDVRFFVTAVSIQRETGGNLAEILDNLAHVVRERFKILRQVRVHTAHGRFTGYVLLALPAALGLALSFINPDHMRQLFYERMGQTMLVAAMVMQAIGYIWIRRVIKIEV
jgi:tight adherence protein B